MTKTNQVLIALVLVVVGFVLGAAVYSRVAPQNLGAVIGEDLRVAGILYNGFNDTQIASNGVLVGNVSSTSASVNSFTATGATTLSGTNTFSGATTITGTAGVSQTTNSTLKIGSTASGIGVGCLVLGDSGGVTSTPVYITATGATISATTTKPSICK